MDRRKLSKHLFDTLEADMIAGLVEKPAAGGWDDDNPNDDGSSYRPYCVLFPGTASPAAPQPVAVVTEWRLNYAVSSFGASPEQAEWAADKARGLLSALDNTNVTLGDGTYRIQQVYPSSVGAVLRADATDPPTWGQTDNLTVWLSKES